MIITIDGPIATGKSTIARRVAEKLGFIHFDTGAMYRCLTYSLIKHQTDFKNSEDLQTFLDHFTFEIKLVNGHKRYFIEGEEVSDQIRGEQVTRAVSEVSAIKAVRKKLVALQQSWAEGVDAVFEGRDLGTDVFPKAELKIFLTGRTEVRAKRRYEELCQKFPLETKKLTLEQTIEEINRRDLYDSTREISPLRQAADAFIVDTSDLTIDEVVNKILELKNTHQGEEHGTKCK